MTSHVMNVLGVTVSPPSSPVFGGADNFFFDPKALPSERTEAQAVWGGIVQACDKGWYFGDSTGFCNVTTGNPASPVAKGYFIRVRSIRATATTDAGWVYLRSWHNSPSSRQARWGAYLHPGVLVQLDCGEGFDSDTLPFIETTTEASVEIVYDLIQGRFP